MSDRTIPDNRDWEKEQAPVATDMGPQQLASTEQRMWCVPAVAGCGATWTIRADNPKPVLRASRMPCPFCGAVGTIGRLGPATTS